MVNKRGRDLDVFILHHHAAPAQLVDVNQRRKRDAALVGDAGLDVDAFISKNSLVIFSSGGGPHASTRVRRPAVHASQIRLP